MSDKRLGPPRDMSGFIKYKTYDQLGSRQKNVVRALVEHGVWHRRAGWVATTPGQTRRILDSLVRAGWAQRGKLVGHEDCYRPSEYCVGQLKARAALERER